MILKILQPAASKKRPILKSRLLVLMYGHNALILQPLRFNFSWHDVKPFYYKQEGGKTKRSFELAIKMFCKVDPKYRRGHVEMVYKAANLMEEYGLEKDLDAYKMIFDLFPKVYNEYQIPSGLMAF